MPRQRTPDGELTPAARRIMAAVGELFYQRGINAVGVEAVADAAGVTKKTLYDRFGSKDELIAAYLRERDHRWRAWLRGYVERNATTPTEKVLVTFDALDEWMRDLRRGCAFINARAELADDDHPGRKVIAEHKRWVRDYLASLLRYGGFSSAESLADDLMLLHEGLVVTLSQGVVKEPTKRAKRLAECALGLDAPQGYP